MDKAHQLENDAPPLRRGRLKNEPPVLLVDKVDSAQALCGLEKRGIKGCASII